MTSPVNDEDDFRVRAAALARELRLPEEARERIEVELHNAHVLGWHRQLCTCCTCLQRQPGGWRGKVWRALHAHVRWGWIGVGSTVVLFAFQQRHWTAAELVLLFAVGALLSCFGGESPSFRP